MSPSPIRRRHRLVLPLVGAVLALGLLSGCAGQREPDGFSDKVEASFIQGCSATATDDEKISDPETFCQCAYDALSDKQDGVEFKEFKRINTEVVADPGPLPASFTKYFEGCEKADQAQK